MIGEALGRMSVGDMLIGGFGVFVVIGTLGAVTNAVLKDNGFGTFVNGIIMFGGMLAGVAVRSATLGF